MKLIKTPIKGTVDQLPKSQKLRDYVSGKIKEVYSSYGFTAIDTPCIEHIENLTGKQGGENEKLIFKILKRGEKLEKSNDIASACDCGLRYDLTLPLARYYANNQDALYSPFKAMQIGLRRMEEDGNNNLKDVRETLDKLIDNRFYGKNIMKPGLQE